MFNELSCLIRALSADEVVMPDKASLSELICNLTELLNSGEYSMVLFWLSQATSSSVQSQFCMTVLYK